MESQPNCMIFKDLREGGTEEAFRWVFYVFIMTSSQKSADVSKILNQGVLFLDFLVDPMEVFNSAGLYLSCFIFKDFRF